MMKILVTGKNSGLGKFLYRHFDCDGLGREDEIPNCEYDAIVHCAANTTKEVSGSEASRYIDDNIHLTERLLSVKCSKIIYISTVDIYPGSAFWSEDNFKWNTYAPQSSIYGVTKMVSETIVMKSSNWMILRCSSFLNKYARKNSVTKILDDLQPCISVNEKSECNCILASDVAKFIELSLSMDFQGIYNVVSTSNMLFKDIANKMNKEVTFGKYFYTPGKIDNHKICSITDIFNKSTEQCIDQFNKERLI